MNERSSRSHTIFKIIVESRRKPRDASEGPRRLDEDDALGLAAAVESDSEHMIARAIREAADERDLTTPDATAFEDTGDAAAWSEDEDEWLSGRVVVGLSRYRPRRSRCMRRLQDGMYRVRILP